MAWRGPIALVLVAALAGCMRPRPPRVPPPRPQAAIVAPGPPANGSLWRAERAENYAFLDVRAHFPGDLLTVLVAEQSTGKKDASTEAKADTSISAKLPRCTRG